MGKLEPVIIGYAHRYDTTTPPIIVIDSSDATSQVAGSASKPAALDAGRYAGVPSATAEKSYTTILRDSEVVTARLPDTALPLQTTYRIAAPSDAQREVSP